MTLLRARRPYCGAGRAGLPGDSRDWGLKMARTGDYAARRMRRGCWSEARLGNRIVSTPWANSAAILG